MKKDDQSESEILRQKAEEQLKKKLKKTASPLSEIEMLKIIHELEVHQIELELQNEELVKARSAALEATEKYIDLYDFAPSGYFTLSKDGEIVELNLTGAKMLGKERSLLKGSRLGFFISSGTKTTFNQFLENVFSSKISESCELSLSTNGDVAVHIFLTGIIAENVEECLVTMFDITLQKKALESAEKSNHLRHLILEAVGEGILGVDLQGNHTFVNPMAVKILGWSVDELLGKNSHTIFHHHHPDGSLYPSGDCTILKTLLSAEPASGEGYFWRKDGSGLPVEYSSLPILDDNWITGAVVTFRDISIRKQSEKVLHESQERFDLAMKATKDGLWDWNLLNNKVYYSPGWKSMLGYQVDDLADDLSVWETLTEKEDLENTWTVLNEIIKGDRDRFEMEFKMKHKEGHWVEILSRAQAVFNETGKVIRVVGTHIDLTERRQAEKELIIAKERAEESDRLKSAFLANMSHEIRTPMNGILGFADLLKEPDLTGAQQQKYISIIGKSGERMLNIINDIIDISKIESGQMEISIKETNINEQIEYVLTFLKPEADKKGLNLYIKESLPSEWAIVKTDREKLYAVLTNLIKNAIKYTREGSIELGCSILVKTHGRASQQNTGHVSVEKGSEPVELQFYVKDTGIGIPKKRQEAIFSRFVQADVEDKSAMQGAGLGLSISRSFVEMLGGKIWVDSDEGNLPAGQLRSGAGKAGGSIFYFTLPVASGWDEQVVNDDLQPGIEKDYKIEDLSILIVEDDEPSQMFLIEVLEVIGKEILLAKTGVEAIDICRNNPGIDLVLMDIKLPDMNGYDATRQIREFNRDVIIIAQTAYGLAGDRKMAIEAGCNAYISKPIKKNELLVLIDKNFKNEK